VHDDSIARQNEGDSDILELVFQGFKGTPFDVLFQLDRICLRNELAAVESGVGLRRFRFGRCSLGFDVILQ
jgi:hypothetical protein